jgi:hypothetical protein
LLSLFPSIQIRLGDLLFLCVFASLREVLTSLVAAWSLVPFCSTILCFLLPFGCGFAALLPSVYRLLMLSIDDSAEWLEADGFSCRMSNQESFSADG